MRIKKHFRKLELEKLCKKGEIMQNTLVPQRETLEMSVEM